MNKIEQFYTDSLLINMINKYYKIITIEESKPILSQYLIPDLLNIVYKYCFSSKFEGKIESREKHNQILIIFENYLCKNECENLHKWEKLAFPHLQIK